jgi:hypothetical protein
MKNGIFYSLALSTVLLSACDISSGQDEDAGTGSTAGDQADYNSYVEAREDALTVSDELAKNGAEVLDAAPTDDTAQMRGTYAISADNAFSTELVGDMTMNVDFGNETVSGSLSNNYLDGDGTGESQVTELDGNVSFRGTLDLDPNGGFYDVTNTTPWQLEASGTGTLTDSETTTSLGTEYRLDIDLHGDFYDTSDIVDTVPGVGDLGDIAAGGIIEGNLDVTTDGDTVIYDITDESGFFVYELDAE